MTTSIKTRMLSLAGLAVTLFAYPALAHHSFAMFDNNRVDMLSGTVEQFEYINPHAWIHLTVADESGGTATWSFEMGSVGQLVRDGWNQDSIAVGDEIEVGFHPLRDGSYGGQFRFLVFPDDRFLCQGGAGANSCDPEEWLATYRTR